MLTYVEYAPTGFDRAGAFLPDRQDWLVVPVGINRDSGPLEASNFATALQILGGERRTVEVHRFGHWACGWFEIILVHPKGAARVEKITRALEDYPVLDEEDYCAREWDDVCETWQWHSLADRVEACQRAGVSIFAARSEAFPSDADHSGMLYDYLRTP